MTSARDGKNLLGVGNSDILKNYHIEFHNNVIILLYGTQF